jgi:hypothetical protein
MLHDIPLAEHILGVGKKLLPLPGESLFEDREQTDGMGDMEEGGGGTACFDMVGEEGFRRLAAEGEVAVIGDKHAGLKVFPANEDFVTGRLTESVTIRPDGLIDIDGRGSTLLKGDFL